MRAITLAAAALLGVFALMSIGGSGVISVASNLLPQQIKKMVQLALRTAEFWLLCGSFFEGSSGVSSFDSRVLVTRISSRRSAAR